MLRKFLSHIENICRGDWEIIWFEWDLDFGFYYTYFDGNHYALNLKLFSIYVFY